SKLIVAIPIVRAVIVIFFSHRARNEGLREIGFRFDNFLKALRLLLAPMLMAVALGLGIGWRLGSINFMRWHPTRFLIIQLVLGFGWGLVQQYVLQGFLNRRAMTVLGKGWTSVFVIAAVFATLHLPNPLLTAITFAAGIIWSAVYQRVPNLFAVAISHSIMTWLVVSTIPPSALNQLRVGIRYFF
ncbi:MAG TPA: CPBP family glutamic-type intramembrane protease, partial [Pyrinomonadaceae bacterium]|nr:CPBP family glutamic-type intramembrane protease [Pyrinomonadaceae bacterium]